MGLIGDSIAKAQAQEKNGGKGLLDSPNLALLQDDASEPVVRPKPVAKPPRPAPEPRAAPPAPMPAPAAPVASGPVLTRQDLLRVLDGAPRALLAAFDPMLATGTPSKSTKALDMPALPGDLNVQVRVTQESHHLTQAFNNLARNNAVAGIPDPRAVARFALHIWRIVYGPEILARYQKLPTHLAALPPEVQQEVQRCTWDYQVGRDA